MAVERLFAQGEVLEGAYQVGALIGRGGMSQVYEALDQRLQRRVAIKTARVEYAKFLREEALALAAFQHPAVVTVHALGQHRGLDFIVLERLYGTSLAEHLQRRRQARDRMTVEETIDILLAVADGLALVHRAGLAHRDLKPGNLFLSPGNRVVLLDFGLFMAEGDAHSPQGAAGTPQYMAPELVKGGVPLGERHFIDLYALGLLAFEMLAGQLPFDGPDGDEIMRRQREEAPPDLFLLRPDVPPALAELVTTLLRKAPEERLASAEAVAWSLRQLRARPLAQQEAPLQVLIVDDDPHAVRLIELCVREALPSAQVRVADDGLQGLALAQQKPPDLLLTDLQMPGMNGLELAMYLRATHLFDSCRIIPLSGRAQEHDIRLLRELGLVDFVAKDAQMRPRLQAIVREVQRARRQPVGRLGARAG